MDPPGVLGHIIFQISSGPYGQPVYTVGCRNINVAWTVHAQCRGRTLHSSFIRLTCHSILLRISHLWTNILYWYTHIAHIYTHIKFNTHTHNQYILQLCSRLQMGSLYMWESPMLGLDIHLNQSPKYS